MINKKEEFFMKRLLVYVLLMVAFVFAPVGAMAQTGGGVEISPVRGELVLNPGESGKLEVKVTNNVAGAIVTSILINDFEPLENGSTQLLSDGVVGPNSVREFIGEINTATLQPKENYMAVVPVNVPIGTAPGTYYSVIRFVGSPLGEQGEAQTGVTLNASVGYIVLLQVEGSLTEAMTVTNVVPSRGENKSQTLSDSPDSINVTVSNDGQTILKPFGTTQIFDFRNKEVASAPINQEDIKVNSLPNTKRTLVSKLTNQELGFGRYKAVTTIAYGKSGETITHTTTFWVIPPVTVALIGIVLALVVLAVYIGYRRMAKPRR